LIFDEDFNETSEEINEAGWLQPYPQTAPCTVKNPYSCIPDLLV